MFGMGRTLTPRKPKLLDAFPSPLSILGAAMGWAHELAQPIRCSPRTWHLDSVVRTLVMAGGHSQHDDLSTSL